MDLDSDEQGGDISTIRFDLGNPNLYFFLIA